MKIAIIGSRNLSIDDLHEYISPECTEIVSGGACGVDSSAEKFATEHNIKLTVFLPEYEKYGRAAPIIRNRQIVDYADTIIAFWDGCSKGTLSVIKYCEKTKKPCSIIVIN